jgi:MFS family permease
MLPSAPSARVAALLFAVAWGTNHFVPLLLVYRASLKLSPVELSILFGVYAVGLVPGLLLGGPLSDRRGRRAVVLPSSAIAFAGTCVLAWGSTGFPVLLAGRFIVGLGAGSTFSAGTAWVQDLAEGAAEGAGARRAAVALSSGFGGGPLVSGILAQWLPAPMLLPYLVQGALLLPLLVGVALLPASPQRRPSAPDAAGERVPLPAGFGMVALAAPWVFIFASVSAAVIPALVRVRLGSFAVVFAGLAAAVTLLTAVVVQPLLRPWPPRRAAIVGMAIGSVGLACGAGAASNQSPLGALFASLLLGCGYGGCLIAGLRFVEMTAAPGQRGRVTGVYYTLTYLGFASPLALATLAKHIGDVPSLLVALACAALTLCGLALPVWHPGEAPRSVA